MLPKLVIFDMDGTIVQYSSGNFQSSWDAIGFAAGKKEEWERQLEYYLPRPEQYKEWVKADCRLLTGIPVQPVAEKIFPPPYTPGFKEFCVYLKEKEVKTGIISSGVDFVAKRIQQEAGLDFIVANEVHIKEGKFTGKGKVNVGIKDKGKCVKRAMRKYASKKEETAFFGDHFNDQEAWKEVGFPMGMNIKSERCCLFTNLDFSDFYQAKEFFEERLERDA